MKLKTTTQWFSTLEEPYKSAALSNLTDFTRNIEFPSLVTALIGSFDIEESKQGSCFWGGLIVKLIQENKNEEKEHIKKLLDI